MGRQDRDISEDEDHLAAHEQQKIADADRIAILRAAVSGVRNIPPETFGEIFAYLKEGCVELPPKKGGYSFPWTLAISAPVGGIFYGAHPRFGALSKSTLSISLS